jgi:hypothetical protein
MLPKPSLSFPNAVLSTPGCGNSPPNTEPEVQPVPAVLEVTAGVSPVYDLFRYRLGPDLFCAIPEDRPVPIFIEAPNWTYAGRTDALAQGVFDLEAATTGSTCLSLSIGAALKLANPFDHSHHSPAADRARGRSMVATHKPMRRRNICHEHAAPTTSDDL